MKTQNKFEPIQEESSDQIPTHQSTDKKVIDNTYGQVHSNKQKSQETFGPDNKSTKNPADLSVDTKLDRGQLKIILDSPSSSENNDTI